MSSIFRADFTKRCEWLRAITGRLTGFGSLGSEAVAALLGHNRVRFGGRDEPPRQGFASGTLLQPEASVNSRTVKHQITTFLPAR